MWKIGFPKLGKNKKMEENGCPNIGKTEKRRKNAFPNLGRIKNLKGCISQPLEEQKILLGAFPTPWASDFSVFHSSEVSDGLFFPFFIHQKPRTSISMRGFPPIRLLFGVVNSRVSCRVTNRNAAELTDLIRVCRILGIPRAIRVCIYRI